MNVAELQARIDKTNYWDAEILDFRVNCLGDEAVLYVDDTQQYWELTFRGCHSLSYKTDANYRKLDYVRNMTKSQLGYYGQGIHVSDSAFEGFCTVHMDLFLMEIKIVCKTIQVQKVEKEEIHFFWEKRHEE